LFGQATQPTQAKAPIATTAPAAHVLTKHPHVSFWDQLNAWMNPAPKQSHPTPAAHIVTQAPTPSVTGTHIEPQAPKPEAPKEPPANAARVQEEMSKLEDTVHTLQSELSTKTMTSDRIVELQKQLTDVLSERSKMEEELVSLKRLMANSKPAEPQAPPQQNQVVAAPSAAPTQPAQPTVSLINTQDAAIKSGLPRLTTTPNVITGIIKDDTNNFLPAILVTVVNKQNVPMRALKTNKLGQFAASTPLPNDTYIIEAEDPRKRFTFDRVQITLSGAVVPAIEVIAKSQKQLVREQLTQEIFGKNQL
jgi:hypothetical protein